MNFVAAAAELRQQEIVRLRAALVPRPDQLRRMTLPVFGALIADMLQRFDHAIVTYPRARHLVTTKGGKKFITECAPPTEIMPIGIPAIARLHDAVIAASAERGSFITARSFTAAAEQYAESAPVELIDGKRLVKALNRSRKHELRPQTYCHSVAMRGRPARFIPATFTALNIRRFSRRSRLFRKFILTGTHYPPNPFPR